MQILNYLLFGFLGALGGVLGNLVAAILQSSIGRFTAFQAIVMSVGIVVAIALSYKFQTRLEYRNKETEHLLNDLAQRRSELQRLLDKAQDGSTWRLQDAEAWGRHQQAISYIRDQLNDRRVTCAPEYIDTLPVPEVDYLIRTAGLARQTATVMMVPFVIAFGISFYGSPVAQNLYLATRPRIELTATVVAITMETSTPHPTAAANKVATPTANTSVQPTDAAQPQQPGVPETSPIRETPIAAVIVTASSTRPLSRTLTVAPPQPSTSTPRPIATVPGEGVIDQPRLLFPEDGQVFKTSDSIELSWSNVALPQGYYYLLVVEHRNGATYVVTDTTQWKTPAWLHDAQSTEGIGWWVASCRGAALVHVGGNS